MKVVFLIGWPNAGRFFSRVPARPENLIVYFSRAEALKARCFVLKWGRLGELPPRGFAPLSLDSESCPRTFADGWEPVFVPPFPFGHEIDQGCSASQPRGGEPPSSLPGLFTANRIYKIFGRDFQLEVSDLPIGMVQIVRDRPASGPGLSSWRFLVYRGWVKFRRTFPGEISLAEIQRGGKIVVDVKFDAARNFPRWRRFRWSVKEPRGKELAGGDVLLRL